jgi:hypothetical protein
MKIENLERHIEKRFLLATLLIAALVDLLVFVFLPRK